MSWKKYFKTYDGMPEKMPASTGTGVTADADTKDIPVGYQKSIKDSLIVFNDMGSTTKWI